MGRQIGSEALAARIDAAAAGRARLVVAIAGAPGSGKSTLVEALAGELSAGRPGRAVVMPMDGYHMDNAVLAERGLAARKGAPETFDVDGFAADLARVRTGDRPVLVPVFDRRLDLARAAAREIAPEARVVLVEGNYLLLAEPPWSGLRAAFDLAVMLEWPEAVLRGRLVRRWLDHGHDRAAAEARADGNDMVNARRVAAGSAPADLVVRGS